MGHTLFLHFQYALFVMRPHADDFDGAGLFQDLVDKAVLDVYPAGVSAFESPTSFWYGGYDWNGSFERISSRASAFGRNPAAEIFFASLSAYLV